jgi:hypothetical protein
MRRVKPHWLLVAALPVLLLVVLFLVRGPAPPQQVAAAATPAAPPVDGITCDPADHQAHAISVHLAIVINGVTRDILANVGTADALVAYPSSGPVVTGAGCYYWLHTGKDDGVVHVDPPTTTRRFTLGDFFDVWHQPLGTNTVATDEGQVTSYVNGTEYAGSPRTIPLTDHEVIQLDVGRQSPPTPCSFPVADR